MSLTVSSSILDTIGATPMVQLQKITKGSKHKFFAKMEYFNPGGSVKDRIALSIIEGAEKRGELKPGGTLVEATSGNTGIGLALVAAIKGYKCIFVLPAKMSEEKRAVLRAYGARVIITPIGLEPEDPMSHYSVAKKIADTIKAKTGNCFYTNQYHNPDNFSAHYNVTGPEIWNQMSGKIDAYIAGVGTGGTLSGVAKYLKEKNPAIKVMCMDPIGSILSDLYYHGKVVTPPASYQVEGIGEDMLPDNCKLNLYDGFLNVNDKDAFAMTRRLIAEEGLCVGPSGGLILAGAMKYAETLEKPSNIVLIMPDSGKAYLTKVFNDKWMIEKGFLSPEESKTAFNVEVMAAEEMKNYV
ncbi:MAG: cysteine synthase family protein [Bdellovibrio sp.]|nr:cysteine synthase family protein [Bdellovibrio sp.]